MHYLSTVLPFLALVASIDARVVNPKSSRKGQDAGPVVKAACPTAGFAAAAGPCSSNAGGGGGGGAGAAKMEAAAKAAAKAAASSSPRLNTTTSPNVSSGNASMSASGGGAAGQAGARAIYFMTNQDENSVVILPVQADGTLAQGSVIATGGKGASLIDAMTGQPAQTDTLASQGAIRVAGNTLFAVNAGSNSLSMFAIDQQDPAKLVPVGQPVSTGGDFPTSVAVSDTLKLACVGHTGAQAGISCARFDEASGVGAFDALRPFDLGQTNPPTGPLNGIGATFFSEDSSSLITTVKGDPMDPNQALPGFVSVFPVTMEGYVGDTDTQTTPAGTAVLFGTVPIPIALGETAGNGSGSGSTQVLTTDASFGSATLDLANLAEPVATTRLANQAATCWATVSAVTGTGFVTDVAVNHLVEVDLRSGALIADLASQNGNPGMLDLQAAGAMVYALAPGNGTGASASASVTVFDISGGPGTAVEVQNFPVPAADNRAMGMAFHT